MNRIDWKKYLPYGAWIGLGALVLGAVALSSANGNCPFSSCGTANISGSKEGEVNMNWMTDFNEAKKQAEAGQKILLISFSGSDWCRWCMKLDGEVLNQPEFAQWAKDNAILLKADFPRNVPQADALKLQNAGLAQYYNVEGFPTIILAGPDGAEIARTGYLPGGAAAYVKHLETLRKK